MEINNIRVGDYVKWEENGKKKVAEVLEISKNGTHVKVNGRWGILWKTADKLLPVTEYEDMQTLRGKMITKVKLNRFPDGRGGFAYNPEIYLNDGSILRFLTQETESEYGVSIIIARPK